jgi:hypothetical protein
MAASRRRPRSRARVRVQATRDLYNACHHPCEGAWACVAATALIAAGVAYAQFPIMDRVADKVIQKYQTSTCQQLWQEKAHGQGQPKPEMEQRAITMLQQDPQMRQAFFNKIAAPIVNKMFECGMIP